MDIIFGNIFSLLAQLSDAVSGTRKTKKGILFIQSISQVFYIISALFFAAYSTAVQNAVSIFRNLYGAIDKHNKFIEWTLIIVPVLLGLYFNNQGLLGVIPVVANLGYSLALFIFTKNPTSLKIAFFICICMFVFFNICIYNYVGAIFGTITIITTGVSIIKELKQRETK